MSDTNRFTIVQMNDTHGYLEAHQELFYEDGLIKFRKAGGFARISTLANEIRKEAEDKVLFCDNGDTFHGTYAAVITQGNALVPVLNKLHIDAMTAHWDFAYDPATLKKRVYELTYPMIAINVYNKETNELYFPPYTVKELGDLRVGVIGIASNIIDKTMPKKFSEGVYFTLGKEELPNVINTLKAKEIVDIVVLLSHLGLPQDVKLLSEIKGIDVCLSGHTHNRLYEPIIQGDTIIIQSGCHGSFITHLDLEVKDKKVISYNHKLIEITQDIKPNAEIQGLIDEIMNPYKSFLEEPVGKTNIALHRGTNLECSMDNFLLKALINKTNAEIAFSNGWRYGAPIIPGDITMNDLYNIVPMNPPISTVELSGEEIVNMLEENLEHTFSQDPFNQMGGYVKRCYGIKAYIKIENPKGTRIQKLFIGEKEVERENYYNAAFITEQGVPIKYGKNRIEHNDRIVDVMKEYLKIVGSYSDESNENFIVV